MDCVELGDTSSCNSTNERQHAYIDGLFPRQAKG